MNAKKIVFLVALVTVILCFVACVQDDTPAISSSESDDSGLLNSADDRSFSEKTTLSDDAMDGDDGMPVGDGVVSDDFVYQKDAIGCQDVGYLIFARDVATSNATKKYIRDEVAVSEILSLWNGVSLKKYEGSIKPSSSLSIYGASGDFSFSVGDDYIVFQGQNYELPSNFKDQLLKLCNDVDGMEVAANSVSKLTFYNRTTGKKKILTDSDVILSVLDFVEGGYDMRDRLETYNEDTKMLFVIESEEINYQTGMPYCAVYREDGTLIVDKRCYPVSTDFYDRLRALYLDLEVDEVSF